MHAVRLSRPGRLGFFGLIALLMLTGSGRAQDAGVSQPAAQSVAHEESHAAGHTDPVTPLLLGLALILFSAKVGAAVMVKLKQPAVLGELLVGVLMGNAILMGYDGFEVLRVPAASAHGAVATPGATTLGMLARIGVILL